MRQFLTILIVFVFVFSSVDAFTQISRKNQFELYAGAGFPLSPDGFKDYYKVGLSLNVQYVLFPSYRLGIPIFIGYEGFTVDKDAINSDFQDLLLGPVYSNGIYIGDFTEGDLDVDGSANTLKFGIGLRPYLTSPESSTQFFLFGTATYNVMKEKQEIKGASGTFEDLFGNVTQIELGPEDFEDSSFENDNKKFGAGFGAGIEVPLGERMNLIFQGMYNMIFTEKVTDDITGEEFGGTTSFVGVTAGVVF